MRRFFLFIVFICCIGGLHAQVPVHEEPRHVPVFENDKIRLLSIALPPGDTTQYHVHHTPSLFVFFTSTSTASQLQGGAPTTGRSAAGTMLFENLAPPHVRIHRVWNIDKDTFRVMDIELLSKDSGFAEKPITAPHVQKVIDTAWVRAYNLVLDPQEAFQLQEHKYPLLVVAFDSGTIQLQQKDSKQAQAVHPKTFFWIPAGEKFALKNTGTTTTHFALIELP